MTSRRQQPTLLHRSGLGPYFGIVGASLVVKGTTGLGDRWVPRAPNCPRAPELVPSALELR